MLSQENVEQKQPTAKGVLLGLIPNLFLCGAVLSLALTSSLEK
jgi:hypothetical protein